MEWKVVNALNRDVERQHLNKILKEIRAAIAEIEAKHKEEAIDPRDIVGQMVSNNRELGIEVTYNPIKKVLNFVVKPTTVELGGDLQGEIVVTPGGDTSVDVDISPQARGIPEAPMDGYAYWRRTGGWDLVGERIESLNGLDGPGIAVLDDLNYWQMREIEGTAAEIVVSNGDGNAGNPVVGLSDLTNTGVGASPIKIYTRDAKGRIAGDEAADTGDLPEGSNLYFTEERVYEALKSILVAGANITLSEDDIDQEVTITATGGGGGGGGVDTVTGGPGISVDNTDPANPVVSASLAVREGVATITLTAAETIHNNRAVLVESDTIRHPDIAVASDSSKILGITRQSGSTSDPVLVQTAGPVTNGSWSWTPGPVYATDEGVLSQTAPTTGWVVSVGKAINSTTIEIDISLPIIRS